MASMQLQAKIAAAILQLLSTGNKPSQGKIIQLVGGSYSTVGPIFKQLSLDFDNFADPAKLQKFYNLDKADPHKLVEENAALKSQNKVLNEHNLTLEAEQLKLKQQVVTLENSERHYRGLYQILEAERGEALKQFSLDKEQQIQALLKELAATHRQHTEEYRNFSFTYDDKLLQKELRIKELTTELMDVQSKLAAYEKQALPQMQLIKTLRNENVTLVNKISMLEQQTAELVKSKT